MIYQRRRENSKLRLYNRIKKALEKENNYRRKEMLYL